MRAARFQRGAILPVAKQVPGMRVSDAKRLKEPGGGHPSEQTPGRVDVRNRGHPGSAAKTVVPPRAETWCARWWSGDCVSTAGPAARGNPSAIAGLRVGPYCRQPGAEVSDDHRRRRGLPRVLRSDNGREFCGKAMLERAHRTSVAPRLIEPGKPNRSAHI